MLKKFYLFLFILALIISCEFFLSLPHSEEIEKLFIEEYKLEEGDTVEFGFGEERISALFSQNLYVNDVKYDVGSGYIEYGNRIIYITFEDSYITIFDERGSLLYVKD